MALFLEIDGWAGKWEVSGRGVEGREGRREVAYIHVSISHVHVHASMSPQE